MKEEKKEYLYKWHRWVGSDYGIHFSSYCLSIGLLFGISKDLICLYISIILVIITTISFIIAYNYWWDSLVYVSEEKFWTKTCGKYYEWKWEDITACKLKVGWYSDIIIITNPKYKKLKILDIKTISNPRYRSDVLLELAAKKGERLKQMFHDAIEGEYWLK